MIGLIPMVLDKIPSNIPSSSSGTHLQALEVIPPLLFKQAIKTPFGRMDRALNLWSYEIQRAWSLRILEKVLNIHWGEELIPFVKILHFINTIMSWPILLWYCLLISCFIVFYFNASRLVSFNIFCCRKNHVSFQGSKEFRGPKRDEEDEALTIKVYVLP